MPTSYGETMRRSRGFTLVEMMMALGVSALVLVSTLTLVRSQQRTYYGGQKGRAAQGSGRAALLYLEQKVAMAGFGLDPAHAFDFSWYGCDDGCVRDRIDGPDELVYYARNPNFRVQEGAASGPATLHGRVWETTDITGDTVKLKARLDDTFRRGQILQLVCTTDLVFTYATVAATVTATADGELPITIDPVAPDTLATGEAADPFRRQDMADTANADATKWNACLGGTPRAFLVDRYRFFVRVETMDGDRVDPYLVLDTGVDTDGDDDIDEDDEILIAEGIENFQVAYGFVDPALPTAGTAPGTAITIAEDGTAPGTAAQTITPTDFPGDYDASKIFPMLHSTSFFTRSSSPLPESRKTNAQANIRTIRIALVARSPEPTPDASSNLRYDAGSPLWIMNFDTVPDWITTFATSRGGDDGYLRTVLETSISVPNMASRGLVPN